MFSKIRYASIFCSLLFLSCVVLPSQTEGLDQFANRAPKILDESLDPASELSIVQLNSNCNSYTYSAIVEDSNNDTIYYQIFLDYNFNQFLFQQGKIPSKPNEDINRDVIQFTVPHNNIFFSSTETIYNINTHVVELLVSDGRFSDDILRQPEENALTDRATWTILLEDLGPCTN